MPTTEEQIALWYEGARNEESISRRVHTKEDGRL